jgi:hypothetical protein
MPLGRGGRPAWRPPRRGLRPGARAPSPTRSFSSRYPPRRGPRPGVRPGPGARSRHRHDRFPPPPTRRPPRPPAFRDETAAHRALVHDKRVTRAYRGEAPRPRAFCHVLQTVRAVPGQHLERNSRMSLDRTGVARAIGRCGAGYRTVWRGRQGGTGRTAGNGWRGGAAARAARAARAVRPRGRRASGSGGQTLHGVRPARAVSHKPAHGGPTLHAASDAPAMSR